MYRGEAGNSIALTTIFFYTIIRYVYCASNLQINRKGFDKMHSSPQKLTSRDSGIELLKIAAIFLIILSHVVQTLRSVNHSIPYQDYVLDLSMATTNIQHVILTLFSYFGALGNNIFFVCSAWFLLRSSGCKKQKWLFMLLEVWVISMVFLVAALLLRRGNISGAILLKSVFPTLFSTNWYLTCYLLFYPIHPLLNLLIRRLNQQSLFRLSAAMFFLYCCLNFLNSGLLFYSRFILWITIYFVMAYMQQYMGDFANDRKKNGILLLFGIAGFVGIALLTNYLGLHISFMEDKMLHWAASCNPFLIAISIALFNLARNVHFQNGRINYLSSLSMLVYLIHENLIFKTYYRPLMLHYVYQRFGYDRILLWVIVVALLVTLFSVFCSVVYDKTLRPLVRTASSSLYSILRNLYLRMERKALKLH